jgi:hypothetical protein
MTQLTFKEAKIITAAQIRYRSLVSEIGISLLRRTDFDTYRLIRWEHGDIHLNQAFDVRHVKFGVRDFWLLAENEHGEPIATYCLRRFVVDDFYDLIRSLTLWFSKRGRTIDPRFTVECRIPAFGGEVVHGGGLWIRRDYRGAARLAEVMPRLARAAALLDRPFDHDTAMIRNEPGETAEIAERKAAYMGKRVYGFARVHRFVNGWFPPEEREAVMHLCHATRAEAIASLFAADLPGRFLGRTQFRKPPLVDQDDQPVSPSAVLRQRQEEASV